MPGRCPSIDDVDAEIPEPSVSPRAYDGVPMSGTDLFTSVFEAEIFVPLDPVLYGGPFT